LKYSDAGFLANFSTHLMIRQLNNRFNFINFVIWLLLREIQFIKPHYYINARNTTLIQK